MICALPELKFVPCSVVNVPLVSPVILPPVITALPLLKLVACAVVALNVVNPFALPPVITALPEAKFVAVSVVTFKFVIPLSVPPVICALPLLKLVACNVVTVPAVEFNDPAYTAPAIPAPPATTNAPVVVLEDTVVFAMFAPPNFNVSKITFVLDKLTMFPDGSPTLLNKYQLLSM